MYSFIKTTRLVLVIETISVVMHGIKTWVSRVSIEQQDGSYKTSPYMFPAMSPESSIKNIANKVQGTIYFI